MRIVDAVQAAVTLDPEIPQTWVAWLPRDQAERFHDYAVQENQTFTHCRAISGMLIPNETKRIILASQGLRIADILRAGVKL